MVAARSVTAPSVNFPSLSLLSGTRFPGVTSQIKNPSGGAHLTQRPLRPSKHGLTHLHPSDGDVVGLHRGPPGQPRRRLRGAHGRGGLDRVDAASVRVQLRPLLQRQLATGEVGPGLGAGVEGDLSAIGLQGPVPGQTAVHGATWLTLGDHDEGLHAQADAQGREAPQGLAGLLAFAAAAAPAPQLILGGGPVATGLTRDA